HARVRAPPRRRYRTGTVGVPYPPLAGRNAVRARRVLVLPRPSLPRLWPDVPAPVFADLSRARAGRRPQGGRRIRRRSDGRSPPQALRPGAALGRLFRGRGGSLAAARITRAPARRVPPLSRRARAAAGSDPAHR